MPPNLTGQCTGIPQRGPPFAGSLPPGAASLGKPRGEPRVTREGFTCPGPWPCPSEPRFRDVL